MEKKMAEMKTLENVAFFCLFSLRQNGELKGSLWTGSLCFTLSQMIIDPQGKVKNSSIADVHVSLALKIKTQLEKKPLVLILHSLTCTHRSFLCKPLCW